MRFVLPVGKNWKEKAQHDGANKNGDSHALAKTRNPDRASPEIFRASQEMQKVMARIRSLKPDFFKDEDLSTLSYEARLLYQGLWCFADREGRLEDRPKYLKVEIFPYDNVNIEKLLNLLSAPNIQDRPEKVFIRRYTVNSKKYIDIPEFLKHQSPHNTEKESLLPPFNGEITVNELLKKNGTQDAPLSYPISESESLPNKKSQKTKYADSVFLTDDEYKKLQEVLGQKNLEAAIEQLDYSITVKGGKYKDHCKTLLNWNRRGFFNGANNNRPTANGFNTYRKPIRTERDAINADAAADADEITRRYYQKLEQQAASGNSDTVP